MAMDRRKGPSGSPVPGHRGAPAGPGDRDPIDALGTGLGNDPMNEDEMTFAGTDRGRGAGAGARALRPGPAGSQPGPGSARPRGLMEAAWRQHLPRPARRARRSAAVHARPIRIPFSGWGVRRRLDVVRGGDRRRAAGRFVGVRGVARRRPALRVAAGHRVARPPGRRRCPGRRAGRERGRAAGRGGRGRPPPRRRRDRGRPRRVRPHDRRPCDGGGRRGRHGARCRPVPSHGPPAAGRAGVRRRGDRPDPRPGQQHPGHRPPAGAGTGGGTARGASMARPRVAATAPGASMAAPGRRHGAGASTASPRAAAGRRWHRDRHERRAAGRPGRPGRRAAGQGPKATDTPAPVATSTPEPPVKTPKPRRTPPSHSDGSDATDAPHPTPQNP